MADSQYTRLLLNNPIHGSLQFILEHYHEARERDQRLDTTHSLWQTFRTLDQALRGSAPVQRRQPNLTMNWSLGKGNWARVPWVAFLDRRETTTTRQGVYGVFLFCEDMSGVYLTLNQGVTQFIEQDRRPQARAKLRARAEQLRREKYVSALSSAGFLLDNHISLHTEASLGVDYEYATVAYKLYHKDGVPLDRDLQQDIEALLQAYDGYLKRPTVLQTAPASERDLTTEPVSEPVAKLPDLQPTQLTPSGSRVFVSHSHTDIEFCRAFVHTLRSHNLHVWYDEHNLGSGMLRETIEHELTTCNHFIVILSPAALQSAWVKREYNAALDLEDEGHLQTFLPVMAEHCTVPLMLRGYKRIQGTDGGAVTAADAAAATLRILRASDTAPD